MNIWNEKPKWLITRTELPAQIYNRDEMDVWLEKLKQYYEMGIKASYMKGAINQATVFQEPIEKKLEAVKEVLSEISEGKGAFNLDPHKHCANIVDNLKGLAVKGLKILGNEFMVQGEV